MPPMAYTALFVGHGDSSTTLKPEKWAAYWAVWLMCFPARFATLFHDICVVSVTMKT